MDGRVWFFTAIRTLAKTARCAARGMHAEPEGVSDLQDFLAKSHRTPAMRLRCEPSPHTRLSPDALLLVCTADYCGQRTGMEHCVSEIR